MTIPRKKFHLHTFPRFPFFRVKSRMRPFRSRNCARGSEGRGTSPRDAGEKNVRHHPKIIDPVFEASFFFLFSLFLSRLLSHLLFTVSRLPTLIDAHPSLTPLVPHLSSVGGVAGVSLFCAISDTRSNGYSRARYVNRQSNIVFFFPSCFFLFLLRLDLARDSARRVLNVNKIR